MLGVCLGFQLLFEHSDEGHGARASGCFAGGSAGCAGHVKVPHMGWNTLTASGASSLLGGARGLVHVLRALVRGGPATGGFVATTDYGGEVAAAVESGNKMGTQFHPEKSGAAGLRVYANSSRPVQRRGGAGEG